MQVGKPVIAEVIQAINKRNKRRKWKMAKSLLKRERKDMFNYNFHFFVDTSSILFFGRGPVKTPSINLIIC